MSEVCRSPKNEGTIQYWKGKWDARRCSFHEHEVNRILQEQMQLLNAKNNIQKICVPLCGKSLDMAWMIDQGYYVVGIDVARQAVEEFFTDRGLEWTETEATSMGRGCQLLQNTERNIRLYRGDINLFNSTVEGQFDFIWDRAAMIAINRNAVKSYACVMKSLLRPGGSMLIEALESVVYIEDDAAVFQPPPFNMHEEELKSLFEPECTVDFVEKEIQLLNGKSYSYMYYLITKTP